MVKKFEGTVLQVFKAVKDKQFMGAHVAMTYEKKLAAFGVTHTPKADMVVKLSADGELFFLVECDVTNRITGYVGKIHSIYRKDTHLKEFAESAKRYSAYYYDYYQYNTIYLVENPVCVPHEVVEILLNGRPYLSDDNKKFKLTNFFKNRPSQLYLKKA